MVAYTEGEAGGTVVAALLSDPAAVCYAHSINLCEVYYQGIPEEGNREQGIGDRMKTAHVGRRNEPLGWRVSEGNGHKPKCHPNNIVGNLEGSQRQLSAVSYQQGSFVRPADGREG